jgi:hypothetical protein
MRDFKKDDDLYLAVAIQKGRQRLDRVAVVLSLMKWTFFCQLQEEKQKGKSVVLSGRNSLSYDGCQVMTVTQCPNIFFRRF